MKSNTASDKSYTLTANTEAQIQKLSDKMKDGKQMTAKEIADFLGRKWINGVMHYLAQRVNVEEVKDGRKIIAYRVNLKGSTAPAPSVSVAAVKEAAPKTKASKPRKSKKGSETKTLPDGTGAAIAKAAIPVEDVKPMAAQVAPEAAKRVIEQTDEAKAKVAEAIETINRRAAEKKEEPAVAEEKKPEVVNSFDDVGPVPAFLKRT